MQNRSGEVNLRFISNTMQNISLMPSMLLITAISRHEILFLIEDLINI